MSGGYFLQEFGRNLRRSPLAHLGSLFVSTLLFILFNMVWIGSHAIEDFYDDLFSELTMEVFFADSISDKDFTAHAQEIQSLEGVAKVVALDKDKARERLTAKLGADFLAGDTINPLPRSIQVHFERGSPSEEYFSNLNQRFEKWSGALQVSYNRQWLKAASENRRRASRVLRFVMLGIFAGVSLNAALLVGLVVRAKTGHFKQMRLLGAGSWFLGMPFVVEGVTLTAFSAALSWGAIIFAQSKWRLAHVESALPSYEEMGLMILVATAVGFFGALFAVSGSRGTSR
jgi:cell division protein FtsX